MSNEVVVGKAAAGDRLSVFLVFLVGEFLARRKRIGKIPNRKKRREEESVRKSTAAPLLERLCTRRMSGVGV